MIFSANTFQMHAAALFVFCAMSTGIAAQAAEEESTNSLAYNAREIFDPLLHWSVTPSVGVRVVSLIVTRKSDGYTGTLTNDGSFSEPIYLALDVETPVLMLSDKVGITVRSHSQTFSVSRQEVPSSTTQSGIDYKNLGTAVNGIYSYLGPTIFFRSTDSSNIETRYGLGFGEWKAWFQGDIILAPEGTVPTAVIPHTTISGKIDGATGPMAFIQARGSTFKFEIAVSHVTFSNGDFDTTLHELGMSIGYTIGF